MKEYKEFTDWKMNDIIKSYCNNDVQESTIKGVKHILTIPDIHGDVKVLIDLLIIYKIIIINGKITDEDLVTGTALNKISINKKLENIVLIQTGDIMDGYRPGNKPNKNYIPNDLLCIDILLKLREEAKELNNVHIILLLGNHEISNITDHGIVNAQYQKNHNYQNLVRGRKYSEDLADNDDLIYDLYADFYVYESVKRDTGYDYTYGSSDGPGDGSVDNLGANLHTRLEKIDKLFKAFICSYLSVIRINDTLFSHTVINTKSLRLLIRIIKRLIVGLYKQGKIKIDENSFDYVNNRYDEDKLLDMIRDYPSAGLETINRYLRYILISLYYSMYKFDTIDDNIDKYKKYIFKSDFYSNENVFDDIDTYKIIPNEKERINGELFYNIMNKLIISFYYHDPYNPRYKPTDFFSEQLSRLFSIDSEYIDINQYPEVNQYGENIDWENTLPPDDLITFESKRLDHGTCYEYNFDELRDLLPKQSYYNYINNETFDIFKINNIFIGHIPHEKPIVHKLKINSDYMNPRTIYYNDVGLSRAFNFESREKTLFIFSYTDEDYPLNKKSYYNTYDYQISIVKNM